MASTALVQQLLASRKISGMLESKDLVAKSRNTMALHEAFKGVLIESKSIKLLLYAQDTNTGLKKFLDNLFKLAAYSDPTKFISSNALNSALKVVNNNRVFFTLKWANAETRFFRGLAEVIEDFGSKLEDTFQNLDWNSRSN